MEKVILKSLKEAVSKKSWNWVAGSAGTVSAILLAGKNYLGSKVWVSIVFGVSFIIALYVLRFLLILSRNVYRNWYELYKESVYGDAIVFLKDAFSRVHWLRKLDTIPDDKLKQTMAQFCQQLKLIYDKKTKSCCAVSIKLARKAADEKSITSNTRISNLCRDKDSQSRDTVQYQQTLHSIFSNTCFNNILADFAQGKNINEVYYINNHIAGSGDYLNTSKQLYNEGKLPYASELVVPIIPHHNENDIKFEMVGFLCVDCQTKEVFDSKYDVSILQGVADGIYDVIYKHSQESQLK